MVDESVSFVAVVISSFSVSDHWCFWMTDLRTKEDTDFFSSLSTIGLELEF